MKKNNVKRIIQDNQLYKFRNPIKFTVNGKLINSDVGRKELIKIVGGKKK